MCIHICIYVCISIYNIIWRWEIKYSRIAKASRKVTKESVVPMDGHRFGHRSDHPESSGQRMIVL